MIVEIRKAYEDFFGIYMNRSLIPSSLFTVPRSTYPIP